MNLFISIRVLMKAQSASNLAVFLHLLSTPLIQPHASLCTLPSSAPLPPTCLSPLCLPISFPFSVLSSTEFNYRRTHLKLKTEKSVGEVAEAHRVFFSSCATNTTSTSTQRLSIHSSPFSFFIYLIGPLSSSLLVLA